MNVKGSYTFRAPRQLVWDLLMDPDVIAKVLPGVQSFSPVGQDEYQARVNLGIGVVKGEYTGHVALRDIVPPTGYRLILNGNSQRGFVKGEGSLELVEQGGTTVLNYAGNAQIGGQLAGVGQRLLESAARTLIGQGFKALEAELEARQAAAGAPAAPPSLAPAKAPRLHWRARLRAILAGSVACLRALFRPASRRGL